MSKGNPSKKTETALAVLTQGGALDKPTLAKLQSGVVVEIKHVDQFDTEVAARRILIGLALHRIKGSLKHGDWLPWFKKNVKGTGYRNCAYAMKLAAAFVEKSAAGAGKLDAIPADAASLAVIDKLEEARGFITALKKFVGDKSFAELLDEHNLKDAGKIGGARAKGKPGAPATPDEETLYFAARDEIGGFLNRGEEMLVKENRLQFLAKHPEEVRGVVEGLRTLADRVEKAAKPILEK